MEHNDNEQRENLSAYQPSGPSRQVGNEDASRPFVPVVLARLGLSQAVPSPAMSEKQVLESLNSPVWQVRLAAVQQLAEREGSMPLSALLLALHDEHENVRIAAARALGMLASQAPVEPLVNALRDSAWSVRVAAVQALGKVKGRAPVEPLVAALRDEDASVRAAAAWALGTLGKQCPLEPLANALHDPTWIVREAAVLALGERGTRVPAALLLAARSDADEPVRQAAELVLQRLYSESPQKGQRRRPIPPRLRLFPRVAAGMAALVIITALLSWLAISHRPHIPPPGYPTAITGSGIFHAAGGAVLKVAWSPDGKDIAAASAGGVIQVWDTATGHTTSTYRTNFLKVLSLVWSSGHSLLVVAEGTDRTIQVWNAIRGESILTTTPLQGIASAATWSPDGKEIAFDGGDNTVQVWNVVTGKRMVIYTGHTGRIAALSWSPDGSEIASASADQTVQVWNAATGHKDWPSFVHTDAVSVVAWSPDNNRCAVATARGLVEVWDNPSWQNTQIEPADKGWSDLNHPLVVSIAWSPDSTRFAFTTADGLVQVWNAGTTSLLYIYRGHSGQVNEVVWSPDGSHIASASADGTVQVWPNPPSVVFGRLRAN